MAIALGSSLTSQAVAQQESILDAKQADSIGIQTGCQCGKAGAQDQMLASLLNTSILNKVASAGMNAMGAHQNIANRMSNFIQA